MCTVELEGRSLNDGQNHAQNAQDVHQNDGALKIIAKRLRRETIPRRSIDLKIGVERNAPHEPTKDERREEGVEEKEGGAEID